MALEFVKLIRDPRSVAAATRKFHSTIEQSFQVDQERLDAATPGRKVTVTGAEVRRRFAICEEGFRIMRGDLGWGLARALDTLPHYLRCKLDGKDFTPDKRSMWIPSDGRL